MISIKTTSPRPPCNMHSQLAMAISNSKSPLPVILLCFLLLIKKAKTEFSLSFPNFKAEDTNKLSLLGDATISNGVLQLTKKDTSGNPVQNTVGMCQYSKPIQLYDRSSGEVADFTSEFTFVAKGFKLHADGFTFFLASSDFKFSTTSGGGFLGLFDPGTAFDPSENHIVAIEFDSFTNEWDPAPPNSQIPHIGVDVSSIRSEQAVVWDNFLEPEGAVATARISYESRASQLSVSLTYPADSRNFNASSSMTHIIDLRTVLPEQVLIGFSAASGNLVETHDIVSWSFLSTL